MKLWLAIRKGGKIVETSVLAWSHGCWRLIVPKRPVDEGGDHKLWVIEKDRRRPFGKYANKMMEKFNGENRGNHNEEILYGFFALVGIGTRWADRDDVDWCLVLGDKELATGDVL